MSDWKPVDHILDEFLAKHDVTLNLPEFSEVLGQLRAAIVEEVASVIEEYADDLEPPTTSDWLELRDWFKDLLHELAAKARATGGVS